MRLTVLGKSPSWQDAGGACSGYLLEEDDTTVLIDCGNGVFSKLREQIDYVDVDAVVLLPPPRRPLPRPDPVRVRAVLRAAPAARARAAVAGHRQPGPPAPDRAARLAAVLSQRHRQLGPARADRDARSAWRSTTSRPRPRSARSRSPSGRCRTSGDVRDLRQIGRTARRTWPTAPTRALPRT